MDGSELQRLALGGQRLQVVFETDEFVVRDASGNAMWRLRYSRVRDAPFETWLARSSDDCWSIYAEGSRRDWRCAVRPASMESPAVVAYRRRWRLNTWDVWTVADRWYVLRFTFGRAGTLTDDEHVRLARVSYLLTTTSFIDVERQADAVPGIAMLLLLSLRLAIFANVTRVAPSGG